MIVPDLRRDMDVGARQTGTGQRAADILLVAVHLRRVDVTVAEREGPLHRLPALVAFHAPGAQAQFGHAQAMRGDHLHRRAPIVC